MRQSRKFRARSLWVAVLALQSTSIQKHNWPAQCMGGSRRELQSHNSTRADTVNEKPPVSPHVPWPHATGEIHPATNGIFKPSALLNTWQRRQLVGLSLETPCVFGPIAANLLSWIPDSFTA
ncbi:hypothetical protein Y1Q_0014789 [Alligator mississippiensis]|uniref:Secreted protein n=1 Tax=Alligator mississippiensis TaxID=8496 RepID=A0A151M1X4_ALLMI|nr:hypothetical protein Y1Q_0014789 [Alligator mississippiensis]